MKSLYKIFKEDINSLQDTYDTERLNSLTQLEDILKDIDCIFTELKEELMKRVDISKSQLSIKPNEKCLFNRALYAEKIYNGNEFATTLYEYNYIYNELLVLADKFKEKKKCQELRLKENY